MGIFKSMDAQIQVEMAKNPPFRFSADQRAIYTTIGGTPHLDGNYTVFGEVIEGLDIVDKIATTKTLPGDRPENDVRILRMTIEKP
jgi:peptidylprolyl isomerase